jgi:predicted nucleotide-binding protein
MIKRPSTPTTPIPDKVLSVAEMQRGILRIKERIAELDGFNMGLIQTRNNPPETLSLQVAIAGTLAKIFGEGTTTYARYEQAASIPARFGFASRDFPAVNDYREKIGKNIQQSKLVLQQAIRALEDEISDANDALLTSKNTLTPAGQKIFLVHGHDEAKNLTVARFLEKLDFEVVILHEQPNKGRTIITKFREEAADVGFAIVLMTPDDHGAKLNATTRPRARQNVVFELGFFLGALGAERVAALIKGDVEKPSDFDGVVYISLDDGNWRIDLAKELKAVGFEIDMNRVI